MGKLVGFDGHKRIKGTKIHAIATKDSFPVAVTIGSAREHDDRKLIPLMESISVRREEKGRPKKRPKSLFGDSKYGMPLNIFYLVKKGVRAQIPKVGKRRPGRPRLLDKQDYRNTRSMIARFFSWIKALRRVVIRYDRLTSTYMGFVNLACIIIYLRILQ